MKIVDAKGLECPKPVIETKKALDGKEKQVKTIVDNKTAITNLRKLATKLGYEYEINEIGDNFEIIITKEEGEVIEEVKEDQGKFKNLTLLITKDKLGEGNDELGKILIKGYIYTLTEMEKYPKKILFVNSGVNLSLEDSEVIDDLKKLEDEGVEILSCGTCLDYYKVKDKLAVGEVTNMYTIVESTTGNEETIVL